MEVSAMEVGVRELRDNLSRYLDRVRSGEEMVVTDRGRAIARVLPMGTDRVLDQLITDGVVTAARKQSRRLPRPIKAAGTVSDLAAEQQR
jgi:prevent-host-death family protein